MQSARNAIDTPTDRAAEPERSRSRSAQPAGIFGALLNTRRLKTSNTRACARRSGKRKRYEVQQTVARYALIDFEGRAGGVVDHHLKSRAKLAKEGAETRQESIALTAAATSATSRMLSYLVGAIGMARLDAAG